MFEHLHCPECGSTLDEIEERMTELEETVATLGIEIQRKQKRIGRMRKEQQSEHPPEYNDAMEVARYWQKMLKPTARDLTGPRVMAVIVRLQGGFDKVDLMKALEGYHAFPNTAEFGKRVRHFQGGTRRVELEYLMKTSQRVEEGIDLYEREKGYDQDLINDGGSRPIARLCDYNHSRADHALYRLHGHEACMHKDCTCSQYDDLNRVADEWHRQNGRKQGQLC